MHPPASVSSGAVTAADGNAIRGVLNSRLETSSQSTIDSVVRKWWLPFLLLHSLPYTTIPAGSVYRGGVMASFSLHLARSNLKYGTIQGYIWALCEHHIQVGGIAADPLDNVLDWSRWMHSLEVQAWVDSTVEPHEMVPFSIFVRTLRALDLACHNDVLLGLILVFMFHTMSRSETPVPKTRHGQHDFDREQHIRCRDVRVTTVDSTRFVEWGFGNIKQDKRSKRAKRDPDKREWKPVGEVTGILSMLFWYELYLTFVSPDRDPESPFFVSGDGRHAVYQELLDGFRAAMCRVPGVTKEYALKLGLHGLRVLGYNCWRAANGEDVAALQGGWGSMAHRSYGRDTLATLLTVPQRAAEYAATNSLPPMPLDEAMAAPDMGSATVAPRVFTSSKSTSKESRARALGSSSAEPLARSPSPTSAAAVDYLEDIVVEHARGSKRKAPTPRI
jgi:hypothetical protein